MKTLLLSTFFLFILFQGTSQNCQGNFLLDSLNSLSAWSTAGVQSVPGYGNPPGSLQINTAHRRVEFLSFKAKQTYRLQKQLGCSLSSNDVWTAEFQFIIKSTAFREVACLFVLAEDSSHWQSNIPGGGPSDFNNNDAIVFLIKDSLHVSGQNQAMQAFVYGKKDSIINSQQNVAIDLSSNVDYYTRVQRINASTIKLSVFNDSLRNYHIANSPVLIQIDSTIGNLEYLQFATETYPSGGFRSSYVLGYDYEIYEGMPVGVYEENSPKTYNVGPNPTNDILVISKQRPGTLSVRMISYYGKEVYRKENWTNSSFEINVEYFKPGMYFLEIIDGDRKNIEKVIVQ